MLYITSKIKPNLIYDVRDTFSKLTYNKIQPYIGDMLQYNGFIRILGIPETEQQVAHIGCLTDFGDCSLGDIAASIQVLILSKIAIEQNKPICFPAGLIGDNYLSELIKICKDTDLVSLYCHDGRLPHPNCPERFELEKVWQEKYNKGVLI